VIAGPTRDEETILYADIDLADIITMKQPCDSAGHYARPDVFFFGLRPPAGPPVACEDERPAPTGSDQAIPPEEGGTWGAA